MELLGKMLAGITGFAGILLLNTTLGALPIMLALGVIHHDITARVPALGFWATYGLIWGLGGVLGMLRNSLAAKTQAVKS